MAKEKKSLVWTTFSVANTPALAKLYGDVQKAQATLSAAKKAFEPEVIKALVKAGKAVADDENTVRIGYNFGKLSYAQDKVGTASANAEVEL